MSESEIYDEIIESLDKYNTEIRYSSHTPIEKSKGWVLIAKSVESHFHDTKFFFYGINKNKNASVKDKFKFLNLYNAVVFKGLEADKPFFGWRTATEQGIEFLTSTKEIFGPSLDTSIGSQIELSDEPDFDSKEMPSYDIRPSEYKSIIEDWYVMWLEQKGHWGNQFDEKYFAHEKVDDKGKIRLLNPIKEELAYKKFWAKREALIDSWVKSGRLKTKDPADYLR